MSVIPVWVVPHTHWDREWYRPFQEFRFRLVKLIDALLPLLESEEAGFPHFMLDGQMAVVDDYIAMRPEAEERLRKLVASGKLSVGPWYILMDEFLVSGETIVRDLQTGMARAEDFGGAMEIGYLPDMFGHIAQMPQLLRSAGIERAVVWRGVPRSIDRTHFTWSSPDGSTVLAEYLVHGYGNGAGLPDDGDRAASMIASYSSEVAPFLEGLSNSGGILYMNGTDHQMPRPWLGAVVEQVNSGDHGLHLTICGLASALEAAVPGGLSQVPEGLPAHHGELRSGARANLLMGVASNRVDVKQAAQRSECALERRAEPAAALFEPASSWPGAFLDAAWKSMILNAAHDSVCACSVDEVVDAVLHRYSEARQIADAVTDAALAGLATSLSCTGAVMVNLGSRPRSGIVELVLPGSECPSGCQLLGIRPEILFDTTQTGVSATALLGEVRSQQVAEDTFLVEVIRSVTPDAIEVTIRASDRLETEFSLDPIKEELAAMIDSHPELPVHIRVTQPPTCRVLAMSPEVPGYGWARWEPVAPVASIVRASGTGLANGVITVEVDPDEGTFSLDGMPGFDRLVDSGDHGDTYNYSPPALDTVIDAPEAVSVRVLESGPLRGVIEVIRHFRWPDHVDESSRSRVGIREVDVTTRLTVHAGERLVAIDTHFENLCRDHRVRTLFPLLSPSFLSQAECAFGLVERGLIAEGGPTERGLATYPSRRFVSAGGVTVFHQGLLEYELVESDGSSITDPGHPARCLGLTLVRSTGMLSRVEMAYRPLPAGPPIRMEGPQMRGRMHLRYAVTTGPCDPYQLVDRWAMPLEVVTGLGLGDRPGRGRVLSVEGAEVSALRRPGAKGPHSLEVRVFNPRPEASTLRITDGEGNARVGEVVDLRNRRISDFSGIMELGPWEIATLRLG